MLTGIDVSHHQGHINWTKVERDPQHIDFAFVKRTQADDFVDNKSAYNLSGAQTHVPIVGTYHFLVASHIADPIKQAEYYFDHISHLIGTTLCAVDVESIAALNSYPDEVDAHKFGNRFAELSGDHHLFVYTGRWYWQQLIRNPYGADIGPLWHSSYTENPGTVYGGWDRITMWQYTNKGIVSGIPNRVDMNRYYGSAGTLNVFTKDAYALSTAESELTVIVRNEENGACLHVIGDKSVLIDNAADLGDYGRAGVPIVNVRPSQFRRYEKLRVDRDIVS